MILEAGYEGGAFVRFDDGNDDGRIPTPEVIDDITRRLGRMRRTHERRHRPQPERRRHPA